MEKEQELSVILTKLNFHSISHLEAKKLILNLFGVSNSVCSVYEDRTRCETYNKVCEKCRYAN